MPYFDFIWTDEIIEHLAGKPMIKGREPRRINRELTPEEQDRLRIAREETERELPELIEQGELLEQAAMESTVSGQLRRAVHSSGFTIPEIAAELRIPVAELIEFLTGEAELPSGAFDRLATLLGCELVQVKS